MHTRSAASRGFVTGAAFALAVACASPVRAWGPEGHVIVARLAEAQLTPAARAEADALLGMRGKRYLSEVANWPDQLRWLDPGLFEQTRRLHFVDFHSADCLYDPPLDCRDGDCVVAAIAKYSAILADRARPPAQRAMALAFVVHFVGDIHQPLHTDFRPDAGGNRFQVRWRGRGTNLHKVWDSLMLGTRHLSAAEYAGRLQAGRAPIATGGTPAEWAEEGCRLDRDGGVYPTSHFIDDAYVGRELPVAEGRLRQAGARLARLLNRDLGNG